jgi:hypothetical protein
MIVNFLCSVHRVPAVSVSYSVSYNSFALFILIMLFSCPFPIFPVSWFPSSRVLFLQFFRITHVPAFRLPFSAPCSFVPFFNPYYFVLFFFSPVFPYYFVQFLVLFFCSALSICSFPHVLSSCSFPLFFLCSSVLLSCSSFLIFYPSLRSGLSSCSFIWFFRFLFFSLFVLFFSSFSSVLLASTS